LSIYVQKTGVSTETFLAAAKSLASAQHPVIIYGKGISSKSTATLKALVEFSHMIGAGIISVKGSANSLAASQYNLDKVFELNGHQAAFIALGDDKPTQRLIQKLEKTPFLIVQASYTSQLTSMADVVLPVGLWSEQEGHYVNLDGQLQKAIRSIIPSEEVKSNEEVLNAIAQRLGYEPKNDWKKQLTQRMSPVALNIN
jgi:predicted molibdopterin-dependent oxidoreductase YjgC